MVVLVLGLVLSGVVGFFYEFLYDLFGWFCCHGRRVSPEWGN